MMKPIIDISYWQNPDLINYDQLADSISGANLRGAYGIWKDTAFERHYAELHKRGVPLGCYHYIIGNYTGTAQADIFNQVVKGKELKLGLWDDVEDRQVLTGLTKSVVHEYHSSIELLTRRKVGIYTGAFAWVEIMGSDGDRYADRPLWIASYSDQLYMENNIKELLPWNTWTFWQYSDSGTFDGYFSGVDCNLFNGTEEEYQKYFNLSEIIPEPEPPTNEVKLPTLKVLRTVNIRTQPTTSAQSVGYYVAGNIVEVLEIKPINAVSVWIRTSKGWSAVTHYGVKYME